MLKKNTITKIALIVAAVAFIFSLITLIRAVIIGVGVPFAAIQVIGTLIIVSICAVMLYVLRNDSTEDEEEESEEEESSDSTDEPVADDTADDSSAVYESSYPDDKKERFDLSNFE